MRVDFSKIVVDPALIDFSFNRVPIDFKENIAKNKNKNPDVVLVIYRVVLHFQIQNNDCGNVHDEKQQLVVNFVPLFLEI